MNTGALLQKLCYDRGKRQKDIVEMTGISKSTISNYFKGGTIPEGNLRLIADCFNVEMSYFKIPGTKPKPRGPSLELMLTVAEAAWLMGVCQQTIRNGIREGHLPIGAVVGKKYIIPLRRVLMFMGIVLLEEIEQWKSQILSQRAEGEFDYDDEATAG